MVFKCPEETIDNMTLPDTWFTLSSDKLGKAIALRSQLCLINTLNPLGYLKPIIDKLCNLEAYVHPLFYDQIMTFFVF